MQSIINFKSHLLYAEDCKNLNNHNIQILFNLDNKFDYERKNVVNTTISTSYTSDNDNNLNKSEKNIKDYIEKIDIYKEYNAFLRLSDFTFPNNIKYIPSEQTIYTTLHDGQLKLFCALIQFITFFINLDDKEYEHIIIYVGSAPGININIVDDLLSNYKNLHWFLYDKNIFDLNLYKKHIDDRNRVTIIQDYANKTNIEKLKIQIDNKYKKYKLYLVSDMRLDTSDEGIIETNELQSNIMEILQPEYSQLKFRIPYEFLNNYKYHNGEIFIQAFSPQHSAETRLVVSKKNIESKNHNYDQKYENQMYIFNRFYRALKYKYSNKQGQPVNKFYHTFDNCHDCVLMSRIYQAFFTRFDNISNIYKNQLYDKLLNRKNSLFDFKNQINGNNYLEYVTNNKSNLIDFIENKYDILNYNVKMKNKNIIINNIHYDNNILYKINPKLFADYKYILFSKKLKFDKNKYYNNKINEKLKKFNDQPNNQKQKYLDNIKRKNIDTNDIVTKSDNYTWG